MSSTNANSGSEDSKEVHPLTTQRGTALSNAKDTETKSLKIPLMNHNPASNNQRLKKDTSIMHPSSPSKIQIDSISPKNNGPFSSLKRGAGAIDESCCSEDCQSLNN